MTQAAPTCAIGCHGGEVRPWLKSGRPAREAPASAQIEQRPPRRALRASSGSQKPCDGFSLGVDLLPEAPRMTHCGKWLGRGPTAIRAVWIAAVSIALIVLGCGGRSAELDYL